MIHFPLPEMRNFGKIPPSACHMSEEISRIGKHSLSSDILEHAASFRILFSVRLIIDRQSGVCGV